MKRLISKMITNLGCLICLLLNVTFAFAWDYQIRVPIRFTDLHPEYPNIEIKCSMGDGNISLVRETKVIDVHANGVQDVVFNFDIPDEYDPREARSYFCSWTYPVGAAPYRNGCHPATCREPARLCPGPAFMRSPCGGFYHESERGTLNMGEAQE